MSGEGKRFDQWLTAILAAAGIDYGPEDGPVVEDDSAFGDGWAAACGGAGSQVR